MSDCNLKLEIIKETEKHLTAGMYNKYIVQGLLVLQESEIPAINQVVVTFS